MRFRTLLRHNLFYHWRANLMVLLGVMVGTAVLTGALLVGDSLRGSLRDLTLERLGRVDHAIVSDRFFRADRRDNDLASALERSQDFDQLAEHVAPVILLRGTIVRRDGDKVVGRAGRVQIVGVDAAFWPLFNERRDDLENAVLINQPLADELRARRGDYVEVRLERPQAVPADSLLGRPAEQEGLTIEASPVAEILPLAGSGRFSLSVQQQRPLILYVQLRRLQTRLARANLQPPNSANALLVAAREQGQDETGANRLQSALRSAVTLEDLGLTLRPDQTKQRYISLESRRLLLEPPVVEAVTRLAGTQNWQAVPTLTYLANLITHVRDAQQEFATDLAAALAQPAPSSMAKLCRSAFGASPPLSGKYTPYSAATALDPSAGEPWGPFLLAGEKTPAPSLKDNEILLSEWVAQDLWPAGDWHKDVGKPIIALRYFVEGNDWLLKEETAVFRLAGVAALQGPAADRTLTSDFPGIRGTRIQDWQPPFPKEQWHPEWVRERDEEYWRKHRATPKAFVSAETAQRLWRSRYGQWTSVRIAAKESGPRRAGLGEQLARLEEDFRREMRTALPPEALGMQFQPVKAQGLAAAGSSTSESFGWLFLGFSSFLIASAAMLVGLLFRLGIERRAKEIGLLYAAGFRQGVVQRLLLVEGTILAGLGGLLGLGLAMAYASLLVAGLRQGWRETLQTSFLEFHVASREKMFGPLPYPSLSMGFCLSFAIALLAILWALRGLRRIPPRSLLAGQTASEIVLERPQRWLRWSVLGVLAGAALANLSGGGSPESFFVIGVLLLVAGLGFVALIIRSRRRRVVQGQGMRALLRLGGLNLVRNPGRSLVTTALLASATFVIVAVESFRRSGPEAAGRDSGTGGFSLLAEADVPLYHSPGTPELREALLPDLSRRELQRLDEQLTGIEIHGFRVRPGDDVSCLNLYQPQQPRLLGVPDTFIENRGGFSVHVIDDLAAGLRDSPWLALKSSHSDNAIPVFADEHTATWVLHLSLGDTWTITDEHGQPVQLRLVGLVKGSIFQSELLLSEENFRRLFPSRGGYGFFLVDAPPARAAEVKQTLEQVFGERFGFTAGKSVDRLASFQAVENTYLSTFQVLGGLGLLLGTLGLAVVLMRNVLERQGELALLRALGYPRAALGWLVLAENGFLVLLGLAVGVISATVAVFPHLAERATQIPWLGILGLIALVVIFGLVAGGLAVIFTLRTPLLPALRRE